jgi:uncharacterized protein YndB with AHSA1/START domain
MDTSNPLIVHETRRIDAPAAEIFSIISDPRRHLDFDGSGMLRGTDAAAPVGAPGDEFLMRMYNEEFGDYLMRNRVVDLEPGRSISWEPTREDVVDDGEPWHYRWGFELDPSGDSTMVTEFFDCSRSPADALRILKDGTIWRGALQRSLERLEELTTH